MRVVYGSIPGTNWESFEESTPNDVLDRTTRGILRTDPEWLADTLTQNEITAVAENFGVTVEDPGDGGDVELPADRFDVERFEGSATFTDGGITSLYYKIEVADTDDGDGDVTGLRVEATSDDGSTDSFEHLPDGPDSGAPERSNFEVGLFTDRIVEGPITVTLSAADEDSAGSFVGLTTVQFPATAE
jgi:hypothetical protein